MIKLEPQLWKEKLRFECQGSGKCCTSRGSYGYVYLTIEDRRRMSRVMKMDTAAFTRKHCDQTEGYFHLKIVEGDCAFLEEKKCGVYYGRPTQCRTWPFWPENMNAKAWNRDVVGYCPGAGKGKLHTAKFIENAIIQDPMDGSDMKKELKVLNRSEI